MPDVVEDGKKPKSQEAGATRSSELSGFGAVAVSLARNPIGIIALFIVLIYGFACLVTGLGSGHDKAERQPLIYFLTLFPVLVLAVFAWLVTRHHKKLYAPSDFKNEEHFVELAKPGLSALRNVEQPPSPSPAPMAASAGHEIGAESMQAADDPSVPEDAVQLSRFRQSVYDTARDIAVVHALQPSTKRGQKFDVFIYLQRRKTSRYSGDLSDVVKVEFFLGRYWRNQVFLGAWSDSYLGIRTSAYGPVMCVCNITFADGGAALLYRYIDFEMGDIAKTIAQ